MLRKLLLSGVFLVFGSLCAYAQNGSLTGTVTDSNTGEALIGTNVYIPSTQQGSSTDGDGEYTISDIPEGTYTVRISYVGYSTVEEQVQIESGEETTLNVALQAGTTLSDVIVTGYQTTTVEESNISAQTVTAEKINSRPNVSAAQTLAGKVSGLNIQTTSGQPGANANINIRGVGSINGDSEPLILLDGTPINQDNIGQLNQDIISNVTVLKDAGATAIYGNRGANGVILIETKSGDYNSGVQVSYSGQLKTSSLREEGYDILSGREQLQLEQSALGGNFLGLTPEELNDPSVAIPNTNWVDVFFDPGLSSSHNLSISNGKENIKNVTSFGFTNQDGALNESGIKRYDVRNNLTGRSDNRKFNYNVNTSVNYQQNQARGSLGTGGINQNPVLGALQSVPYLSPEDYPGSGLGIIQTYGVPFTITPLLIIDKQRTNTFRDNRLKLTGRAEGSYEITEGLQANLALGGDYERNDFQQTQTPDAFNAILFAAPGNNTPGFSQTESTETLTYQLTTSLRYQTQFSELHQINAGAYFEMNQGFYNFSGFTSNGLLGAIFDPGDGGAFVPDNPSNDFFVDPVELDKLQSGLLSYFGTLDYSYSNLYGIGLTLRRDASYRFSGDNKWGTFYAISGRWNIANEEFMEDAPFEALKLRASYGKAGNQTIENFAGQFRPFGANSLILDLYGAGAGYGAGISTFFTQLGNPNLKWETTYQGNVGLDFELLNARLRGSVDGYIKRTEDLFQSLPISAITSQTSINTNIGSLENRGVELEVEYDFLRSRNGLNLTLGFIGSYNKQEILDLPQEDGAIEDGNTVLREGGPIDEYFIYPYEGVNPENGNLLFRDADGNLTENPTPADRRYTGKDLYPEYQGSINLDMSYKGVFLQTQWQYAAGIDRFDFRYADLVNPNNIGQFVHSSDILDNWTTENTDASQPRYNAANVSLDGLSDRFLESSDFFRLRYASIGYQFPASLLESVALRGARIFVSGENIVDFTSWQGLDPQTQSNNELLYPNPRIFTLGVDLQF